MTTRASRERSLAAAGFSVVRVFGDCDRRPVEPDSPGLIFVAARDGQSGRAGGGHAGRP